jgi:hypothetical protein
MGETVRAYPEKKESFLRTVPYTIFTIPSSSRMVFSVCG